MSCNTTVVENAFLRESYKKILHKSGLTVYVFPKKLSSTYASLTVRFGSLDRSFRLPGEEEPLLLPDGIAHFLEHKMFESEDHIDTFDKFAATGASANAYTSVEATTYLFSVSGDASLPLGILLDSVTHPYFTEKNVEKEKGIIGQEIKMYEDSSSSRLYDSMMELLYVNHGIRTNICGSLLSISEITPALLYRCHEAFYRPENMMLIVVGDVEAEEVMRVVDASLGDTSPRPEVVREYPPEPKEIFGKSAEFHMDIARPKLCVGVKDVALPQEPVARARRAIAMNFLLDLFFGESSSFFERLYREGLIAGDFSAYYEMTSDCGHLLFSASTDEPERLLSEIRAELSRLSSGAAADEADFLRIQKVHYAEFIKDFDSTEEIATALLESLLDGVELFELGGVITSVSFPEVLSLARECFAEERLAYTVIRPMKGGNQHA